MSRQQDLRFSAFLVLVVPYVLLAQDSKETSLHESAREQTTDSPAPRAAASIAIHTIATAEISTRTNGYLSILRSKLLDSKTDSAERSRALDVLAMLVLKLQEAQAPKTFRSELGIHETVGAIRPAQIAKLRREAWLLLSAELSKDGGKNLSNVQRESLERIIPPEDAILDWVDAISKMAPPLQRLILRSLGQSSYTKKTRERLAKVCLFYLNNHPDPEVHEEAIRALGNLRIANPEVLKAMGDLPQKSRRIERAGSDVVYTPTAWRMCHDKKDVHAGVQAGSCSPGDRKGHEGSRGRKGTRCERLPADEVGAQGSREREHSFSW